MAGDSSGGRRPVALVTGATRGIGLAVARELARTHRVLVGGRNAVAASSVADALGDAAPFVADLADESALAAAVEVVRTAGELDHGLDVLVHAAGMLGPIAPVDAVSRAELRRVLELNLVAVADLTRLVLPEVRAARGTVVTVNSGSGLRGGPESSAYCASKFALTGFTECLREEERGHGVRVCSLHPGRVDTDMQRELRVAEGGAYEPGRYLDPVALAAAVRVVVDAPAGGQIEQLVVRPLG